MKKSLLKNCTCHHTAIVLIALLSVFLHHDARGENPKHLLFQAGAGHQAALDEIAEAFQRHHPGLRVDVSYNRSGFLVEDLAASKKGDLFMPGGEYYILQARGKGCIAAYDSAADIAAYFVPVIITPRGNPKKIRSIADFARDGVRIGMGDPSKDCSIGLWHEKTFEKAGILGKVKNNTVLSAKCISELGVACREKKIDAAIVWMNAAMLFLRDVDILPVEPEYRFVVKLPIVILKFSKNPKEAGVLKKFILSGEGKAIFYDHAYCIDPANAGADIEWLVKAREAVVDPSIPVTEKTVGPFVREIERLRRAGAR
jgi:molybdate transport system substrate-binding protein